MEQRYEITCRVGYVGIFYLLQYHGLSLGEDESSGSSSTFLELMLSWKMEERTFLLMLDHAYHEDLIKKTIIHLTVEAILPVEWHYCFFFPENSGTPGHEEA